MAQIDTVIVDLQVSNREAVAAIQQATERMAELKQEEAELNKERKDGLVTEDAYIKRLTAIREETERAKDSRNQYTKALRENVKQEKIYADSLNGLRAQLKGLIQEYDNMSKAEREGAKGKELVQHIQQVTDELSKAEQETGRFQRQVGNYPAAFKGFEKYLPLLQGGIKGVTANLAAMGKQLLKLLANPIVAAVAAAVVVFQKLRDAIKRNDEAGTALQKVFAAFKPIIDILRKGLDAVVTVIGKVADGFAKVVNWVTKLIPGLREFADAEQDLVTATDKLEETERKYTVDSAKRSAEVSELKAKAADKEKYSAQERIDMLNKAAKLEEQDLAEAKAIAEERLRLALEQQKVNSDTSDETANNIAQLKAAVYQAEQAYNEGMRSIIRQTNAAVKEIGAEEQQAIREAEQRRKEAAQRAREAAQARIELAKKELEARQAVEDAIVALMNEGEEKEIALRKLTYERQRAALQERLNTEKNMTVQTRELLSRQLTLMQARYEMDITEIRRKAEQQRADIANEIARKQVEERARIEEIGVQAALQQMQNELTERLKAVQGNAEETAWIQELEAKREVEIARTKAAAIRQENYNTTEEYKLALAQATAQVLEAEQKAADAAANTAAAMRQTKQATFDAVTGIADAFNNIAGNMQGLFETLAEGDERYANYANAMAYLQILVSTAVSIANAIQGATAAAAATGVAAPLTLPTFIAQMIGIVTGAVAEATALLVKSKNKPTYATGGVVHGAGTGTSDSVTARVSNGESILTAKATAMFYDQLSAMNVAGGGKPFDKHRGGNRFATGGVVSTSALMQGRQAQQMADAMREAVAGLQPVVSVREISSVQNRVQVKENISKQ